MSVSVIQGSFSKIAEIRHNFIPAISAIDLEGSIGQEQFTVPQNDLFDFRSSSLALSRSIAVCHWFQFLDG